MGLEKGRGNRRRGGGQQVSASSTAPFTLFPNERVAATALPPLPAPAAAPAAPGPSLRDLALELTNFKDVLNEQNSLLTEVSKHF